VATFVLVHGYFHGAWCWNDVATALRARGHLVITPDLPGHGDDPTPFQQLTFERYVTAVVDTLDRTAAPVILVGHSMGGVVISEAANRRPRRVAQLVYVAAFLLRNGQSRFDVGRGQPSSLQEALMVDRGAGTATIDATRAGSALFADCPPDVAARAAALLTPEPLECLTHAVRLDPDAFGRGPRIYIECTGDVAIVPAVQREMYEASPCQTVYSIAASHSPFLSRPVELADLLALVAARRSITARKTMS
jgi:pimeloyl-ACP methyl ester carboxylesterase